MILQLLRKRKELWFERSYDAPIGLVWRAFTEPEMLRAWWGPEQTSVAACEVDLRVGGRIYIVMEAGEAMGKYRGTRWPMDGTFSRIEPNARLVYEARSWTEGKEAGSIIHHVNDLTLTGTDHGTTLDLQVSITQIGPKARMAAFGMRWGYKQQLDKLDAHLAGHGTDSREA